MKQCMLLIELWEGRGSGLEENLGIDGSGKIVVCTLISVFTKNIYMVHIYNKLYGFILYLYSVDPLSDLPVMCDTPLSI